MKRIFFHRKPIMKQRKSEKVEEKVKIKNGRKTEKDTKKAEKTNKNRRKPGKTRKITPADQTRTPACLVLLYGLAHFGFLPHILGKVLEPSLNLFFFVFFFHFFPALFLYFFCFLVYPFIFLFPFFQIGNLF